MYKLIFTLLLLPFISYADETKNSTDKIHLDQVSIHLFLEKTGALSTDITKSKQFMTHNYRPNGEGLPDGEIFHNYLIKVLFTAEKETFVAGDIATLNITNREDNTIVFNKIISDVYIGPEKKIYKSFFISGNECKYQILTVSTKEKIIQKQLPFHCGE